ncbi:MAG: hypothetical protein ACK5NN_03620 [Sphingomonadaceae bacterium]
MNRIFLGGLIALVLCATGVFWWQGRAEVDRAAPPPEPVQRQSSEAKIPVADPGDMRGPAPPEATRLSQEEKRFFRYDTNRDRRISRNEMLSSRTAAFRKLDRDGNNLLTFEEWAVATVERFESADRNKDRELTPEEFRTTAPKPKPKSSQKCAC